jgi:hypothetical protein
MDIDLSTVERAAEAACQAWMKTDLGITMPDRSAADLSLDSQEWADFWKSLSVRFRTVFRMQAEAVLLSTGAPVTDQDAVDDGEFSPLARAAVPEIAAWLEKTAPGLRYKTARDGVGVAAMLLKREVTGEV